MSIEAIPGLIYKSCLLLDQDDFKGYLSLYDDEMRYTVETYSPELRKDMVWLDHDRAEMSHLIKMLGQHVRLPGRFSRHANVYAVESREGGWKAVSSFMLHYTNLDGETQLMAVGRYDDEIVVKTKPLLASRKVVLQTRDLGPGIHVPI